MIRRRQELPDSLELLLDTICNTFGAVIFISMLLSILTEGRSPTSSPDAAAAVDQMIAERERSTAAAQLQFRQLERLLEEQRQLLSRFSNSESQRLAEGIASASESRATSMRARDEQLNRLAQQDAESIARRSELDRLEQRRRDVQRQLEKVDEELAVAVQATGRVARTSRVRPAVRRGVTYMLHNGRLFRTTKAEGGFDDNDCQMVKRGKTQVIIPRPGRGLKLPADSSTIESRLSGFTQSRHFVRLFVSRDSFSEFLAVKDVLVDLQFEYEVIVFDDHAAELFLTSEPVKSFVQ
jgi:hypothetical protein